MNNETSELELVEEKLRAAMLASDIASLDELIDDNLLFVGPDGNVLPKQQDLAFYRSGDQRITAIDFEEQQIRLLTNVASVSVLAFVSGDFKGHGFQGHFRYLRVWRQRSTGWKVVAGSVSKLDK